MVERDSPSKWAIMGKDRVDSRVCVPSRLMKSLGWGCEEL